MPKVLNKIRRSLDRDRDLPLGARISKGARFIAASASAPFYLRECDVGARPRTIGKPNIDNLGAIEIGSDFICNSTFAPVELGTGSEGCIEIGNSVAINFGTSIHATSRVRLGDRVSIGPHSILWDTARGPEAEVDEALPVEIGDDVWLAGRVTVLPGASVGAGSVITAGSVVDGAIPAGVLAGGSPARVIRSLSANESAEDVAGASSSNGASPHAASHAHVGVPANETARNVPTLRGVVLADFTIADLAIRLEDDSESPSMRVEQSPFDQVIPQLLQGPSGDATDFCVVWTRPDAISPAFRHVLASEGATDEEILKEVDGFCDLVLQAAPKYRMLFVPTWTMAAHHRGLGMIDARPGGASWSLNLMNHRLMQRLSSSSKIFVLDASRWVEAAGRPATATRAWYMGKVVFQGATLAEAAKDIKAAARGLAGQARKLLVLDLDDTLWGGIVGDAGWENLRLGGHDPEGEAFVDFQKLVKNITKRGIVLGIVSKNTESVALTAINSHPEMVLKQSDFVGWRINWTDKARNIADLAKDLNLGLQSVVFIDDNPVERARVRETLPEVLVPEWPEDKLLYPSAFLALRCFDTPVVSKEDAERTALYAAEKSREASLSDVGSIDEWLMSLDIRVTAEPLSAANLPRTTQLLNKTNQMNLTTRRQTEAELTEWVNSSARALWAISVSDRFGDAGLTGILSVDATDGSAKIVDYVLSCRVMGRKVEESLLALAVQWVHERGLGTLTATVKPTAKNKPCQDFFASSGFKADESGLVYRWDSSALYPVPAPINLQRRGH
ncbi:MAG TPA: HAD-IIIC family phosphatase [Gemmatimonadaceae bacterium]|jgi:FkbH-like protein